MNVNIWTFVIVCPLIFLAGFVDSIAGGGGVISLPAYLIAGVPIKLAAGTNKFANGCGTALASYKYMKSATSIGGVPFPRRRVPWLARRQAPRWQCICARSCCRWWC